MAIESGPVGVGEGFFSMPQRTLMWRVGSSIMTMRTGLSCCGKDANVLILSALVELPSSWGSNIAGYAAKEFYCFCLLQVFRNVEADFGGRIEGKGLLGRPLSILGWSCEVVRFWWVVPCKALPGPT